ncbi:MAG: hypothetical protein A3D95_07245 [Betaproteobacteria bacterium RIFCSPHIGHO2_12_FULL_69_13]|nr:MAG: hypothetical protein A3D95_07245 [Betaproteobacteria bacterium RIFCSPHIGHO2_12_FULL_69_13]OGA69292.1 MAG: hypothetical protein A3G83_04780 [Betaproteobacteria bacterium RIFCSPLOWO2_12_FULL_68_20]
MGYTIDIDTGGTFTDCYVGGEGGVVLAKADTTPHDLSQGVLACIERAAGRLGLTRRALLQRCDVVRLSTTVGTNTFINRSGAQVGLLVGETLGGKLDRLASALPLERSRIAPVPESVDEANAGRVRLATRTLLERGARILVIALEGGHDLPQRETRVRRVIAEDYPRHYLGAVPVLASHLVTPIHEGVKRIHTAVLDAYLHPVMSRFLYRVEDQLRADGLAHPLQVANASGATSRVAKTTALRTWGSGPAGGVSGAAEMARRLGLDRVVAVDIGGTSSDICAISDGCWEYEVSPSIEGVAVALPSLRLRSAGTGCGSIVRVRGGEIEVGPDSAGALPGPAAFGLGGEHATVTDAACCLGVFDPARFLGGRRALDLGAARRAVQEQVARPLGVPVEEAAARVVKHAAAVIARRIGEQLADRGIDPAACVLFATGGGGGMLGYEVAARAGLASVCAFPVSPVFSAFGLSQLDVSHSYEAMPAADAIEGSLRALRDAALADMRGEGCDAATVALRIEAEFRSAEGGRVEALGPDLGRAARELARRYAELQLVRLAAVAPGRRAAPPGAREGRAAPLAARRIHWGEGSAESPVYDWLGLPAGAVIPGPAVLETDETTLLVPPGATGTVGRLGELKMDTGAGRRAMASAEVPRHLPIEAAR